MVKSTVYGRGAMARPTVISYPNLIWHITHRCYNFKKAHREWVEAGSSGDMVRQDDRYSRSIGVAARDLLSK